MPVIIGAAGATNETHSVTTGKTQQMRKNQSSNGLIILLELTGGLHVDLER